jgi:hypothetical protein
MPAERVFRATVVLSVQPPGDSRVGNAEDLSDTNFFSVFKEPHI